MKCIAEISFHVAPYGQGRNPFQCLCNIKWFPAHWVGVRRDEWPVKTFQPVASNV
jgi:hypothetical protein